jgi:hypothetical protein
MCAHAKKMAQKRRSGGVSIGLLTSEADSANPMDEVFSGRCNRPKGHHQGIERYPSQVSATKPFGATKAFA